jgi:hypothetical protein
MREVNGVYTQAFNRRHRRMGRLLQGRFKAILVDQNASLLELARYIVLIWARGQESLIGAATCPRWGRR